MDRDRWRALVNTVIVRTKKLIIFTIPHNITLKYHIYGNETSGSIIYWKILEWLHNWDFLRMGSSP
jgi:hypothetical protein